MEIDTSSKLGMSLSDIVSETSKPQKGYKSNQQNRRKSNAPYDPSQRKQSRNNNNSIRHLDSQQFLHQQSQPMFSHSQQPMYNQGSMPLQSHQIGVGKDINPKTIASSISQALRTGDLGPTLLCTGMSSINQAVKSAAIARSFLTENQIDFSIGAEYRDESKSSVSLVLYKQPLRTKVAVVEEADQLRVASQSDPNIVAGSIAGKVRAGERVSIISIGPASVAQTIKAIIRARMYLDEDAMDITFRPDFVHVQMEDGQRSAIQFQILAQQV